MTFFPGLNLVAGELIQRKPNSMDWKLMENQILHVSIFYLAHWIQQPIRELRILIFYGFFYPMRLVKLVLVGPKFL